MEHEMITAWTNLRKYGRYKFTILRRSELVPCELDRMHPGLVICMDGIPKYDYYCLATRIDGKYVRHYFRDPHGAILIILSELIQACKEILEAISLLPLPIAEEISIHYAAKLHAGSLKVLTFYGFAPTIKHGRFMVKYDIKFV